MGHLGRVENVVERRYAGFGILAKMRRLVVTNSFETRKRLEKYHLHL